MEEATYKRELSAGERKDWSLKSFAEKISSEIHYQSDWFMINCQESTSTNVAICASHLH